MSAPAKEAALTFISRFCRQPAKVSSRRFAIMRIQNSSPFSLFLFAMESIIAQLTQQEVWEEFLAYRLRKGRFNWHEFKEADAFVEDQKYLAVAQRLAQGKSLGIPQKKIVNKMGTGKKRVVYSYPPEEMTTLKLIAHLLYKYDDCFAPNCYAFRRGFKAHDAIRSINKAIRNQAVWAYKLDIHNYFNSIPIERLLPLLADILADDPLLYRFFETMLTDNRAIYNGQIIEEAHGVMAGTPTSPFLADVYLNEIDHHFADSNIVYARYSDDIILFANDKETLEKHRVTLLHFMEQYHLEINHDKEKIFTPDEAYEFLGFMCHGRNIDISEATRQKMKGKIKRKARSLMRWRGKYDIKAEYAMKGLINYFNHKCFESDEPDTLNWSRWFFPIINQTEGLKEIDHYLQQNIRFLSTGKHTKTNYRVDYEKLKTLGYRSLVNEFYKFKDNQQTE